MLIADKIKQAIKQSDAFVVLLTDNSQYSPYVQQEIGFAEAHQKPIIPLVQPGIKEKCLAMLMGREYIPLNFDNPVESLKSLHTSLKKLKKIKESEDFQKALAILILIIILYLASKEKKLQLK